MTIAENLTKVRENIARAAKDAGLDERDILLIGATKMNDAARVREAIAAGLTACGENRVQELLEKNALGAYEGAQLHFIGHLQRNKVKQIVGLAQLIHSVDSVELMSAISREAEKKGIVQDILLEVNVAGETSKSGIAPENLPELLEKAGDFPGLRVRGLMAVPPICRYVYGYERRLSGRHFLRSEHDPARHCHLRQAPVPGEKGMTEFRPSICSLEDCHGFHG